jgi:hypothetical protein
VSGREGHESGLLLAGIGTPNIYKPRIQVKRSRTDLN